jgi:hypothetical protein
MEKKQFKKQQMQRFLTIILCEDGEVIVRGEEFTHIEYIGIMTTLFYDSMKQHQLLQDEILDKEMD